MGSWTFSHKRTDGKTAVKRIRVCVWRLECVCTLLCVSLPVALTRLLPPLWLCCAETDSSPTASPARCPNIFWQRKLYHSSRRPFAARSMKLRHAQWLWGFREEIRLLAKPFLKWSFQSTALVCPHRQNVAHKFKSLRKRKLPLAYAVLYVKPMLITYMIIVCKCCFLYRIIFLFSNMMT